MGNAEAAVLTNLRQILARKQKSHLSLDRTTNLFADLEMDSLDIAELSAALEDDLGADPYSAGKTPHTAGEIIDFYYQG